MDKKESAKILGEKIKRLRKSKGFSLMQLAGIVDISDTALSKIETGKTVSITVDLGKKLCDVLNISFNELFEIEIPENELLKKEIIEKNNLISILKETHDVLLPFRLAFIQERTISQLMIPATLQIAKEQHEKGENNELIAAEVRKIAISIYQNAFPDIPLNPYLNLTPEEMPRK
jgi:transcriptional regulator with XRE-family HTH domain